MYHYYQKLAAVLLTALLPQSSIFITVGVLIVIDFFCGVYKSIKNGDHFSSRKMSHTISKIIFYNLAIITGALIQLHIMPLIPFVTLIASSIAIIEFTSITENITDILGFDIFKKVKEYLKRPTK